MSVLLTRGTRLNQPQGPVEVDWANPIARGLQIAAAPIGGGYKDLARNLAWTQVNGPTVEVTNKGKALKTVSGSSQYGYFPCDVKNAPLTILHTSILDSSSNSAVFSLGTASGTERLVLFYGAIAGQYTISPIPNAGAGDTSFTTGIGDSHTSVLVLPAAATPADFYLNGAKGSTGGNYWVPTGAITRFYLSTRVNSTAGIFSSQRSNLSLVWNRALSDAEIASISANPWQLFKPVQRRVWFDGGAAAGGASQTIAFTLDDLTSSVSQTLSHSQSAAFTLDGISSTVNQAATHSQSLSATLDDVTASISQELAGAKSQSIAFTLDGITASVSQTASHAQSLAVTLDDVTVSISQSAAPSSKDQSLAITLDDIFVDIKQAGPRRRQAGGKRNYIIKGKKYHLNDYELAVMIQGMLEEVERSDVEIDDGEAVKKVSRRVWKQLKESNAQLDFTLKELQSKVAIQEIDDEDDIALLML